MYNFNEERTAIDCRSCRYFCRCVDCQHYGVCTNSGPDPMYSGCCRQPVDLGMQGCWCPKDYGCVNGEFTEDMLKQMEADTE
jgi:hypothetical protein